MTDDVLTIELRSKDGALRSSIEVAPGYRLLADEQGVRAVKVTDEYKGPGHVLSDGDISVYRVGDRFTVADGGGWIEGTYASPEEALAAAQGDGAVT